MALKKAVIVAFGLWEVAAFAGYTQYSPFIGIGGFLLAWVCFSIWGRFSGHQDQLEEADEELGPHCGGDSEEP